MFHCILILYVGHILPTIRIQEVEILKRASVALVQIFLMTRRRSPNHQYTFQSTFYVERSSDPLNLKLISETGHRDGRAYAISL